MEFFIEKCLVTESNQVSQSYQPIWELLRRTGKWDVPFGPPVFLTIYNA